MAEARGIGHMTPRRTARGFTLIELLVALAIGLMLLVGIHRILVAGVKTQVTTSVQTDLNRLAQVAMDDMMSRLRGAWGVLSTEEDELHFIDQNGDPVSYGVEDGTLRREESASSYSGGIAVAGDVVRFDLTYYESYPSTLAANAAATRHVVVELALERENHSAVVKSSVRLRNR